MEYEGGCVQVLDKGFIRLEEFMGGDMAVVRSARVSFGKTPADPEKDKKLIRYMLSHDHGTPFEHAVFTFHVKLPIFVARQWIRHRMGSFNEFSMRYSEFPDEFYFPERWRVQDVKNKQGSVDAMTDKQNANLGVFLRDHCAKAIEDYRTLLRDNVAKEMARLVLPVNAYTQWYWTVNARSLMHFLDLRSDGHAQWEMRRYSNVLALFFREKMPWTFEAFAEQCADREKWGKRNFDELALCLAANGDVAAHPPVEEKA